MKQESDATHKKRVLAQIKVEERKRDTHPKKDRGFKRHYSRRRYRFDTYLPWESSHDRL